MNNDKKVIVGGTGFVGGTLCHQVLFDNVFHSRNVAELDHCSFDLLLCAAAPAQKWLANRDPAADRQNIDSLISHLKTVTCNTFVLISTVDVFKNPIGVDEDTPVAEDGLHAYGLHRRLLEKFVQSHFKNHLIVRTKTKGMTGGPFCLRNIRNCRDVIRCWVGRLIIFTMYGRS